MGGGRITLNCVIEGPEIDFVPSGGYCNTWSGWLNMLPIEFKPSLTAISGIGELQPATSGM